MTKPMIAQPKAGAKRLHPRSQSQASPYTRSNVVLDEQWGVKVKKVTPKAEVRKKIEEERAVLA